MCVYCYDKVDKHFNFEWKCQELFRYTEKYSNKSLKQEISPSSFVSGFLASLSRRCGCSSHPLNHIPGILLVQGSCCSLLSAVRRCCCVSPPGVTLAWAVFWLFRFILSLFLQVCNSAVFVCNLPCEKLIPSASSSCSFAWFLRPKPFLSRTLPGY